MAAVSRMSGASALSDVDDALCQFRSVPPRHFDYPAILLLLAEAPCHGYGLVDQLHDLGLATANGPGVYRALAALEQDGLLESWDAEPIAGSTRHVYCPTDAGHRQLACWMAVVATNRDALDAALRRYRGGERDDLPEKTTTND